MCIGRFLTCIYIIYTYIYIILYIYIWQGNSKPPKILFHLVYLYTYLPYMDPGGFLGFKPVSNQFQTSFKPVSNQFQTSFKPASNQLQTSFKPVSNQFQTSFKPVSNQFQTFLMNAFLGLRFWNLLSIRKV